MECSLGIEAGAGTRAIGVLILILMECSLGTAKAAIEAGAGCRDCLNPYSNGMLTWLITKRASWAPRFLS